MLTSKQRAQLKGLANTIDAIFQIGKGGINQHLIEQIDDAIEVRELIKIKVLETAPGLIKEIAYEVAQKSKCELVQVIGSKFILYRPCKEKDKRKISLLR